MELWLMVIKSTQGWQNPAPWTVFYAAPVQKRMDKSRASLQEGTRKYAASLSKSSGLHNLSKTDPKTELFFLPEIVIRYISIL